MDDASATAEEPSEKKGRQPGQKARDRFLKAWGIHEPKDEKLKAAFTVGVTQWDRRHEESERTGRSFFAAQIIAPVAAATATVLAATGISKWAVIPSAITTVTSSLLASFGLRENWKALRLATRELGFEIASFAEGWGSYRGLTDEARIDLFTGKLEELSIGSMGANGPGDGAPGAKTVDGAADKQRGG